jgi:ABC-type microcin C transport system permease subunit YejE
MVICIALPVEYNIIRFSLSLVCSTMALMVPGRREMFAGYICLLDYKSIENWSIMPNLKT